MSADNPVRPCPPLSADTDADTDTENFVIADTDANTDTEIFVTAVTVADTDIKKISSADMAVYFFSR